MTIRPEMTGDLAAIRTVIGAAFARDDEAALVDQLRRDGDMVLSLVAVSDGQHLGHIGFSRVWIIKNAGRIPGVSLAPLSVSPQQQRHGIGQALVESGMHALRDAGETIVFVLGDPRYYARFGFSLARARGFVCKYAGPHFQAVALDAAAPDQGSVAYAPAFGRLG